MYNKIPHLQIPAAWGVGFAGWFSASWTSLLVPEHAKILASSFVGCTVVALVGSGAARMNRYEHPTFEAMKPGLMLQAPGGFIAAFGAIAEAEEPSIILYLTCMIKLVIILSVQVIAVQCGRLCWRWGANAMTVDDEGESENDALIAGLERAAARVETPPAEYAMMSGALRSTDSMPSFAIGNE